jgi:hypothetical protein
VKLGVAMQKRDESRVGANHMLLVGARSPIPESHRGARDHSRFDDSSARRWWHRFAVGATALVIGCGLDTVNPAAVAPQPGLPCGNLGVACSDGDCCPQSYVCDATCPAPQCCEVGNDFVADRKPVLRQPASR